MNLPLRIAAGLALLGAVAAGTGYLSAYPAYRHFPADRALIRLSFSHGAPRDACRRLSEAEIARVAPNMRRPTECPRGRPAIQLRLTVDDAVLLDSNVPPSGLNGDGASHVYLGFPTTPGRHRIAIAMRDDPRVEGFNHTSSFDVALERRRNLVIDFNARTGFVLR